MREPFIQAWLNTASYSTQPSGITKLPDVSVDFTHNVRDQRDITQNTKVDTIQVSAQLYQKALQLALSPLSFLDPKFSGFHDTKSIGKCVLQLAGRRGEVEILRFILRQLFISRKDCPFSQKARFDEIFHNADDSPPKRRNIYWVREGQAYYRLAEKFGLGSLFYDGLKRVKLQRPSAALDFDEYMSYLANNGLEVFSKSLEKPAKVIAKTIENWYKLRGLINTKESKGTTQRTLEPAIQRIQAEKSLGSSPTASTLCTVDQVQHKDSLPFQAGALNRGMMHAQQQQQQQPPYDQAFFSAWPQYDASFVTSTSFRLNQEGVEDANHYAFKSGSLRACESKDGSGGGKMSIQSMISTQKPHQSRLESTPQSMVSPQQAYSNSPWQCDVPHEDIELLVNLSQATRPMPVKNRF
ncbi:hypothetical protein BFJ68_g14459 [Fusarium oxysporum]|uniref:Uncharacterized protein n=2 Tax=Fusarium oxysporum TaxID=5507 RepID=A0A420PUM1_FUSOX|nr:hypothetical protein BFJ65_g16842 [Fusarium oxysporum f. sp. cepae]RKK34668.1 hypothetical protein BFJ67_g13647 [Fusarium oxysporum f. sp. cepae]RKK37425.1 hypothetical protein BFJ66_g12968 [Fusarium oxysporum f. sp. cepae]RKK68462.1 hypothetical protein BFJ69_g13588 [Fusarium oxysporum]RKK96273.1 hypothetical protein BFJ68_g14459 [Fusarium oxysporum]